MEKEQLNSIELADENIESMVYTIRGQKVMLDFDLARIYGYETRNLNRQVKNNIDKFPRDFMFQLTSKEAEQIMMCKNFTSSWGGTRKPPYAFTEQDVYMLMTVLRGELATKQSVKLVRLFKRMKDYISESNNLIDVSQMFALTNTVNSNVRRISKAEEKLDVVMGYFLDPLKYKDFTIFDGHKLDADLAYQEIYFFANHSVLVIDDYVGLKTLQLLKACREGVSITICSDNKAKNGLNENFIRDFVEETGLSLTIKKSNGVFHDRYIVIDYGSDDEVIYHCGASSKDAGAKVSAIRIIEHPEIYRPLIENILSPEKEDLVSFAENVSSTGVGKPSEKARQIMKLYDKGLIDYEAAELAIKKLHKK